MDIWVTIGSILLSLTVTFLFNYFVGLPKKVKQEKQNQQNTINGLIARCDSQDCRINQIQEVIDKMPVYRQQSLDIQESLRASDKEIVDLCRGLDYLIEFFLFRKKFFGTYWKHCRKCTVLSGNTAKQRYSFWNLRRENFFVSRFSKQ